MASNKKAAAETAEQRQAREMIEKIAGNISSLAKSVQSLLNGPLKRRALVILLANSSSLSQDAVTKCLKALEEMEADWLNK